MIDDGFRIVKGRKNNKKKKKGTLTQQKYKNTTRNIITHENTCDDYPTKAEENA